VLLSLLGDDKLSLEETMKRNVILKYAGLLCLLLFVTLTVSGCGSVPGETRAETARRHRHIMRINVGQVQSDVDALLMLDRASKTSDSFVRP
jgi:hypothetical protein